MAARVGHTAVYWKHTDFLFNCVLSCNSIIHDNVLFVS